MNPAARHIVFQVPAILLALVVLYLCITPIDVSPISFKFSDKVAHLMAFGPISFAILWGIGRALQSQPSSRSWWLAFALAAFWGGMIELVQHYLIPTRQGDIMDFVADVAGVGLGLLAYLALRRTGFMQKWL